MPKGEAQPQNDAKKLVIYPFKTDSSDDRHSNIPDPLPKPPFLMSIIAPTMSGKSTLLLRMLFGDKQHGLPFYSNVIDKLYFFSASMKTDSKLKELYDRVEDEEMQDTIVLSSNVSSAVDVLKSLIKESARLPKDEPKPYVFFIIDDGVGLLDKVAFGNLSTRSRHAGISIIYSTQYYKSMTPTFRTQCNNYVFFNVSNDDERRKIKSEFKGDIGQFDEYFKELTKQKYSFIYINKPERRLYKGFEELYYDGMTGYAKDMD